MKPLTAIALSTTFIFALGLTAGCNSADSTKTANSAKWQSVTFYVDGMVWGTAWTTAVEKQLKQLPGVVDATTDMDLQTATVQFDPAKFKPSDAIDSFTERFELSLYEGEIE